MCYTIARIIEVENKIVSLKQPDTLLGCFFIWLGNQPEKHLMKNITKCSFLLLILFLIIIIPLFSTISLWAAQYKAMESKLETAILGGSGIFTNSGQQLGSSITIDLDLADLDNDNDLDAFVTNRTMSKVWLNDSTGQFTNNGQSLLSLGINEDADLGDVDGDGDLDAFVAVKSGSFRGKPDQLWLNDGNGLFTDSGQEIGNDISYAVALGDLDDDEDLDAFVGGPINCIWLNDGTGNFNQTQRFNSNISSLIFLGDIDADGDLDAFEETNCGNSHVWFNDGTANFQESSQIFGGNCSFSGGLADLDGDGDLDIILDGNEILLNDGAGTFIDSQQRLAGPADMMALGDVDGDGDVDVLVNPETTQIQVWINDGMAVFTITNQTINGDSVTADFGDLDGDEDIDIFLGRFSGIGANEVWYNVSFSSFVFLPVIYN